MFKNDVVEKLYELAPLDLATGETVVKKGAANHFLHVEARGGVLYLTNRRLAFRPHPFCIQHATVDITLADLKEAHLVMTMWVIPNGLMVTTKAGGHEHFVVWEREAWLDDIRKQIG